MISAKSIIEVAPAAAPYASELVKQMAEAQIQANPKRAAMFLGQIAVESGGFKQVVESLNYSADALKKLFGRHRISLEDAERYGRRAGHPADQKALANILYGGDFGRKQLGNTQTGDGWKFRGRGLKQLTGRDNVRRFSRAWLGDESLLDNPDRIADPDGAVASAIWFWAANQLNAEADRGTVQSVTRIINGGQNGLPERLAWTDKFKAKWSDKADFSGVTSSVG